MTDQTTAPEVDDDEARFARANGLLDADDDATGDDQGQAGGDDTPAGDNAGDVAGADDAGGDAKPKPDAAAPESPSEPAPEPFEGFSELPEDKQAAIRAALADRERQNAALAEQAKQYEQRWRAQHGQLAPVQQQAARLLEENRRLQAEREAGRTPDTAKLEALKKRFAENYPEDAEALDAFLAPLREESQRTAAENAALRQNLEQVAQQVARQHELDLLNEAHSDWREHAPVIDGWIATLDPVERELAEQWRGSTSAADNIRLLNMYKRDLQIAELYAAQHQAGTTPAPAAKPKARDVDPNPRNRQSPVSGANAPGSEDEERFAAALQRHGIKV